MALRKPAHLVIAAVSLQQVAALCAQYAQQAAMGQISGKLLVRFASVASSKQKPIQLLLALLAELVALQTPVDHLRASPALLGAMLEMLGRLLASNVHLAVSNQCATPPQDARHVVQVASQSKKAQLRAHSAPQEHGAIKVVLRLVCYASVDATN